MAIEESYELNKVCSEPSKSHSDMQEPNVGEGAHGRVKQLLAELKCRRKAHRR